MPPGGMMMMAQPGMVMMNPQVQQMKKDLDDLKELKHEKESKNVYCPMCDARVNTDVRSNQSQI